MASVVNPPHDPAHVIPRRRVVAADVILPLQYYASREIDDAAASRRSLRGLRADVALPSDAGDFNVIREQVSVEGDRPSPGLLKRDGVVDLVCPGKSGLFLFENLRIQ